MQSKSTTLPRVEHDYRIFFLFMTLVMLGMYAWTLVESQTLRNSWKVIPFTLMMIAHIVAHWNVNRFISNPVYTRLYVLGQSLLAFMIVYIAANAGMIFALYMAIIGESIGIFGATRRGFLVVAYYLLLSLINFTLFTNLQSALYWLLSAIPVVVFVSLYVALYNRQALAREQAETLAAELEAANRQLSEYAARVEDLSIANERQRMARELHDTLSQGLAGLILQLEAADAHLASSRPEKAQQIVANAMLNARSTLADARSAIDDLRQQGNSAQLRDLLRMEIARFEAGIGIHCVFQVDLTSPIPEPLKETVIRAAAEALTNIARHAHAAQVWLDVRALPNSAQLDFSIRDDGQGFDPARIPSGHYGLLGLRERILLSGGELRIESAPGQGTHLSFTIPLPVATS
jgi:NarL family two-component system sensor histidine kinase YdfH